ncbi:MAG: ABC transporter permease [Verrucomicrobiota bacterium]|jgi:putative ABC transport system permease protein
MTFADQVRTAWSNLGRRKTRVVLASLGVVVGTVTIVLLVSLASGVRRQINRQFESIGLDRLTVLPPGNWGGFGPPGEAKRSKLITPTEITRWKSWPGVAKATPEVNLPGSVNLEVKWKDRSQSVRMGGGLPRPGPGPGMLPGTPEPVAGTLDLPEQGAIILSQGTAQALGIASNEWAHVLGQSVETVLRTPRGETQSFALHIQGISSERSSAVQASPTDCLAMKSWWFNTTNLLQREGYDSVAIRATDVTQARALIPRLRQEGFQVQSMDMFMEVANRVVIAITVMLALIGGVALLVASIGIANTMVMAVYERTREIGILKAMGASRTDIRRLFMIEAGFIGLAGGVIGLLLGWGLGLILNQGIRWYLQHRELPMRDGFFIVTPLLALGVTLFAAGIGIVAGLLPAHRAATLDPLTALRHE